MDLNESGSTIKSSEDGHDCRGCSRANSSESNGKMVACDTCSGWWHLSCADVSPGVAKRPWECNDCIQLKSLPVTVTKLTLANTNGTKKKEAKKEIKKAKPDPCNTIVKVPGATKVRTAGGSSRLKPSSESSSAAESMTSEYVKGNETRAEKLKDIPSPSSDKTVKQVPNSEQQTLSKTKSIKSTTSSCARLQLKLLQEEKQLEDLKLMEKRRILEEEKVFREKEHKLRAEELRIQEQFLKKKRELEELADSENSLSSVSVSCKSILAEEWINKQRQSNNSVPEITEELEGDSDNESMGNDFDLRDNYRSHQYNQSLVARNTNTPNPEKFSRLTFEQSAARQIWPKTLPTFSGSPEEWPIFLNSFEDANRACGFSNVENLMRLRESLRGAAKEAVATKLIFPESVPTIMETLRRMYGRPEIIVKTMLQKVRRLEAPKPERLDSLIRFGMSVEQLCDHLNAANLRNHFSNPTLLEELVEKLPSSNQLEWVRFKRNFDDPTLLEFGQFMKQIVIDASEVITVTPPKQDNRSERIKPREKVHLNAHIQAPEEIRSRHVEKKPCLVCGMTNHRLRNCAKFKNLNLEARLKVVEQWKLCETCLYDHGKWKCRSRYYCTVENCRRRHHYLLHPENSAGTATTAYCNTHRDVDSSVLLRIIPIFLRNEERVVETFGFIDEGSSLTLMDSELADLLKLDGSSEPLQLRWTSSIVRNEDCSKRVKVAIAGRELSNQYQFIIARTIANLDLPEQSLSYENLIDKYFHLRNIDVSSYATAKPRILIGLDNLEMFAPLESRIGHRGQPIAVRSLLGWSVYGPVSSRPQRSGELNVHSCNCNADIELTDLVRQQFVLEENVMFNGQLPQSKDAKRAIEILDKTTNFINGRYETGLLWKDDQVSFPDSRQMAMNRLKGFEGKLAKNPELRSNVNEQILDYIRKGYAHKTTELELMEASPERVWYLPLNIVSNAKKPNKKRLVWDAAATAYGVSLNSALLKGPDLLINLPSVIYKFREKIVGFGGDVKEMFHQIRIKPEDKHAQRFLFRFDPEHPPDVYTMDVMIFGAACSPCTALYIMQLNADECQDDYPEATNAIRNKIYMDDYFDSADTPEKAANTAEQVKLALKRAGFEMKNWVSNDRHVLSKLGENVTPESIPLPNDEVGHSERVLGMTWDPLKDKFSFPIQFNGDLVRYIESDERPTKRIALRCLMSLFDPLGLLSPYMIHGKLIIQDLWRSGVQWDERMYDAEYGKWIRWTRLLRKIAELQIPRHYFDGIAINDTIQLHIFTDASEYGYGCAAYFRISNGNRVAVNLVRGVSKVAPLKHLSIPRMELQAAVCGARLMSNICDGHSIEIKERFIWTDSTTVLSWIKADQRKYKQFVAVRIGLILSFSEPESWRWVPTRENIADCLTKWGKDTEPESNGRWFTGPSFLYENPEAWPKQRSHRNDPTEERKAHILLHLPQFSSNLIDPSRISKWNVLVRTIATVFRFISNCQRRVKGLPIESVLTEDKMKKFIKRFIPSIVVPLKQTEYSRAETVLWRMVQEDSYPDDVKILTKNRNLPMEKWRRIEKSSPLYKFCPFSDEYGVIRVEGRTANAKYACFDARFPIILDRSHVITQRLLEHHHSTFGHGNRETIFNEIRQRFEINTFTNAKTSWHFNPPATPHMGGVWERMVRSVKSGLEALDDGRKLNDEMLITALAETEAMINSRPLTYMPQDSNEALTPNHFIRGGSSEDHDPQRDPICLGEALRSSYLRSLYLANAAWARWLKEYFPALNRRPKWFEEANPINIGDLVYLAEGPRRTWVRGRIIELLPNRDGRIRRVVVQTASGKLKRAVANLAVMEIKDSEPGTHQDELEPASRGGGCSGTTAADDRT
ncbi:uncharacterized protein LOC129737708 [Uranotaenia lowii]|uniref:uncharacterized protein LOC129737708 n=1 Tax=Uranotaenia lowii TaxID=190385 RepID=UPI00247A1873|nr:uncharacterized protein LOC129737708 [Uranotaenia lowii]